MISQEVENTAISGDLERFSVPVYESLSVVFHRTAHAGMWRKVGAGLVTTELQNLFPTRHFVINKVLFSDFS